MDLNTVLGIASLLAIVLSALAAVLVLGRKDQQLEDVRETAARAEEKATAMETKHAVLEANHNSLLHRVTAIENGRGGCRLPHNHEG